MDGLTTIIDESYLATGAVVMIINILVFVTFLSSKPMIEKYQLLIVLSVSDMIAGLGTFWAGLGRLLITQNRPDLINSTTLQDCLRAPWMPLMTIGGQLPSIIVLIIGLERIVAVHAPVFYHSKISTKHHSLAVIFAVVFVAIDLLAATGERLIRVDTSALVPYPCYSISTYSMAFNDFHNFIIIITRTIGFLLSLVSFLSARRQSVKAGAWKAEMCREVKRMNVLLALSGLSMLLATLPTAALWGYYRNLYNLTGSWPYVANLMFTMNSLVNFVVYIILKEEFRGRFLYLWSCKMLGMKNDNKRGSVIHPFTSTHYHH